MITLAIIILYVLLVISSGATIAIGMSDDSGDMFWLTLICGAISLATIFALSALDAFKV